MLLINEPMLILNMIPNSNLRYNSYYPRWAYDQYRQYLGDDAAQKGWDYLDLWSTIPSNYFTDSPLHINPDGEKLLAKTIAPAIQEACP